MRYSVAGLNFKTAPSEIRGAFSLLPHLRKEIYRKTSQILHGEFLWLSTCNRSELYYAGKGGIDDRKLIETFFAVFDVVVSPDYFYVYNDREAVKHLFEVVTGLDSMVVGEKEIAGQVKDAYKIAIENGSVGKYLDKLFSTALHINKDIRSKFPMLSSPISIPYLAIKELVQKLGTLKDKKFLIIGTGQTAELAAKSLTDYGAEDIVFTSKHLERAKKIAVSWNSNWVERDKALNNLFEYDAVVVATSVHSPIITDEILEVSRKKKLVIIDISIPRATDLKQNHADVEVIFLDDLKEKNQINHQRRLETVKEVREVLEQESVRFMGWLVEQYVAPMIEKMFDRSEEIRKEMMEEFYNHNSLPPDLVKKIDQKTSQLVKKLIHIHLEKVRQSTRGVWNDDIYHLIYSIFSGYEKSNYKNRNQGQSSGSDSGRKG